MHFEMVTSSFAIFLWLIKIFSKILLPSKWNALCLYSKFVIEISAFLKVVINPNFLVKKGIVIGKVSFENNAISAFFFLGFAVPVSVQS